MARARNLKPGFFRDAALVELPVHTRLLFAGLWTLADREGRLEDKPKQIKMEIYPADKVSIETLLDQLETSELIRRYQVNGNKYIHIRSFTKHQNPHRDEKASTIPAPPEHGANTVQAPCSDGANRASTSNLQPSTYLPQPISPDLTASSDSKPSKIKSLPTAKPPVAKTDDSELQNACKKVWSAYASAYHARYGVEPVRNAKINSNVKAFCQRLSLHEAACVASFYLTHGNQKYVASGHSFGVLLMDAEKLRTEWATNTRMTQTQARQTDETAALGNIFGKLIEEARHEST